MWAAAAEWSVVAAPLANASRMAYHSSQPRPVARATASSEIAAAGALAFVLAEAADLAARAVTRGLRAGATRIVVTFFFAPVLTLAGLRAVVGMASAYMATLTLQRDSA